MISRDRGTNQIARKALFTGVVYTNLEYHQTYFGIAVGTHCSSSISCKERDSSTAEFEFPKDYTAVYVYENGVYQQRRGDDESFGEDEDVPTEAEGVFIEDERFPTKDEEIPTEAERALIEDERIPTEDKSPNAHDEL